jgi:hypothetical protein
MHEAGVSIGRAALLTYYLSVVIVAVLITAMQSNLNHAWSETGEGMQFLFSRPESILIIVGLLFWSWRIYSFSAAWTT